MKKQNDSRFKILRLEKSIQRIISHFSFKKLILRCKAYINRHKTKKFKVFVYSPGKTGTSSIHLSLSYLYFSTFKIKTLEQITMKKSGSVFKSHKSYPNFAKKGSEKINIYFVQFREPISRTLSDINENNLYELFNSKNEFQIKKFKEVFEQSISSYYKWWDKFFSSFIDYEAMKNVKNKGYDIIHLDSNNILFFHLTEALNKTYTKSINEHFETDFNNDLLTTVRKTKSIVDNKKYNIVKNQKFNSQLVNEVYNNKYVKLFYNDHDIEAFKKKYNVDPKILNFNED